MFQRYKKSDQVAVVDKWLDAYVKLFLEDADLLMDIDFEIWQKIKIELPILYYLPIRPLLIDCDMKYHCQNFQSYQAKVGFDESSRVMTLPVQIATV